MEKHKAQAVSLLIKRHILAFIAKHVKCVKIYFKNGSHVSEYIMLASDVDRFVKETIQLHYTEARSVGKASEAKFIVVVPLLAFGTDGVWHREPNLQEINYLGFEPRTGTTVWTSPG